MHWLSFYFRLLHWAKENTFEKNKKYYIILDKLLCWMVQVKEKGIPVLVIRL